MPHEMSLRHLDGVLEFQRTPGNYNATDIWLRKIGKGYLSDAASNGAIEMVTAFERACDQRPLAEALKAWDTRRAAFKNAP